MNKFQININRNSHIFIHKDSFDNVVCKMASISSQAEWASSGSGSLIGSPRKSIAPMGGWGVEGGGWGGVGGGGWVGVGGVGGGGGGIS